MRMPRCSSICFSIGSENDHIGQRTFRLVIQPQRIPERSNRDEMPMFTLRSFVSLRLFVCSSVIFQYFVFLFHVLGNVEWFSPCSSTERRRRRFRSFEEKINFISPEDEETFPFDTMFQRSKHQTICHSSDEQKGLKRKSSLSPRPTSILYWLCSSDCF